MPRIALEDERGFNQVFAPVGSSLLRMRRRHDWFLAEARRAGARRILEIGCGTGVAAARMAAGTDAEVVAIDISDAFLDEARARHTAPNLRFEKLTLPTEDPARLGRFDFVFGNGILHHLVRELPQVLDALRRATNPGGRIAFIEPNLANPFCAFIFGTKIGRRWAKLEPDEMAFKPGQLGTAFTTADWQDVQVQTRDFLVPGLPSPMIKPILALEPALEATAVTRWLAQSHFVTARS